MWCLGGCWPDVRLGGNKEKGSICPRGAQWTAIRLKANSLSDIVLKKFIFKDQYFDFWSVIVKHVVRQCKGWRPDHLLIWCGFIRYNTNILLSLLYSFHAKWVNIMFWCPGGCFRNVYELLNLRALKIPTFYKKFIFQCMDKIFCVEFQREPLKFHTKCLTHTLKDTVFIQHWNFKSSWT